MFEQQRIQATGRATAPRTSAMPPTITATLPFLRMRLKLEVVAGTLPIQAVKWRLQEAGEETLG